MVRRIAGGTGPQDGRAPVHKKTGRLQNHTVSHGVPIKAASAASKGNIVWNFLCFVFQSIFMWCSAPTPTSKHAPSMKSSLDPHTAQLRFEDGIKNMGDHLTRTQKNALDDMLQVAMKSPNPQQTFEDYLQLGVKEGLWESDQVPHLQNNLLSAFWKDSPAMRKQFKQAINNIRNYLTLNQTDALSRMYAKAVESPNQAQAFERLLNEGEQKGIWRPGQLPHLKRELLPVISGKQRAGISGPKTGGRKPAPTQARGRRHVQSAHPRARSQKPSHAAQVRNIAKSGSVYFYKKGPTAFLGNFAHCPNKVDVFGHKFQCAEAAFQWRKFERALKESGQPYDHRLDAFFTANGQEAFDLRDKFENEFGTPSDWHDGGKDEAMWEVLQAKFRDPKMRALLDATGEAFLLEHNSRTGKDAYWSDNNDGKGLNMLGKMLAAIRDGKPRPPPNDTSGARRILHEAQSANQHNYHIF